MTATIVKQEGTLIGRMSTSQTLAGKLSTALPDGGYERGYEEGYNTGYDTGHDTGYDVGHDTGYGQGKEEGYTEGLAARTYETWTITYADGTIEEKEVALL